uniref:Probable G-protein coupled receptor 34 n=2 Tax=Latimeria chalumnae TaxID=7897 RepID=H2ZWH3_LATCH
SALFNSESTKNASANTTTCLTEDDALAIALSTFYSITFVLGLTGNIIALWVFLGVQSKRNSIQVYLLNVVMADLLLIFCLPFRIFYHIFKNEWQFNMTICKAIGTVFYMNMYISIILLGLISVDRYVKISQSLQQCTILRKTKGSICVCLVLWASAVLLIIPMISKSNANGEASDDQCFNYRKKEKWEAIVNLVLVLMFWIVFVFLILSYVKIAQILRRTSKNKTSFSNSKKYANIARKSFIVLFIFTICFVPYHTFRFVYIASQLQDLPCYWKKIVHMTNEIMLLFSALNSCFDPVMYFLLSSSMRRTVFQLICKASNNMSKTESSTDGRQGQSTRESIRASQNNLL